MRDHALVLLVDDKPDNLNVLIKHLSTANLTIFVALNGREAISLAKEVQPELILLDVMMPGIDGFETCRLLKQAEQTRDIPVLFMSALNDTVDKLKGFQAGGVDYITKPLQHEEVLARIDAHLTIRRLQQALESKNRELTEKNRELQEKNALISAQAECLESMARTDPLTQLTNRRGFFEQVEHELARCARGGKAFSLILCDIDHFKQVNDNYGHDGGDAVLVKTAELLRESLREQDIPARWGGEEFMLLLPETSLDTAVQVGERIRRQIAAQTIVHQEYTLTVTMSFGLSVYSPENNLDACIKQADEALYRAKENGRNRVVR